MKNYLRFLVLFFLSFSNSTLSLAQQDQNLIPVATSETSGYESFNSYVLKNSIKHPTLSTAEFSLLLTGVSTYETQYTQEPIPVSNEERIEEYDLTDGRVIFTVNMNCQNKKSKVIKILSLDHLTGSLKEQVNNSNQQESDQVMNNALHRIVCN